MPFTFSHPAAILPLHSRLKEWIPLSALVVGSMVPDTAYYLPMPEHFKENAHTLMGTFTSSLPVGILVLLLLYWIGGEVVFLLPSPHREALRGKPRVPARLPGGLLAVVGIAIGAWVHVMWDSFTHEGMWVVERFPLLQRPLVGNRIHVYVVLQNLSTVLGLCVVLYAYDKWMKGLGFRPWTWQKPSWRFYLSLGVAAASFVEGVIESHTIRAIVTYDFLIGRHFILVLLTSFIRNVFVAVCIAALGVKVRGLCSSRQAQPTTIS